MSGFPEGCAALERSAEWYELAHQKPNPNYSGPARELPSAALLWEPALDLVTGSIVDIGCGQGHLAEICALRGITYVCGADVSPTALMLARTRAPGAAFVESSDAALETTYDTAVFLEVLEHVFCDRELIAAVPTGRRVVFSVPNFYTEGHCRWFADVDEVRDRYSDIVQIDSLVVRARGSNAWFIAGGTRL